MLNTKLALSLLVAAIIAAAVLAILAKKKGSKLLGIVCAAVSALALVIADATVTVSAKGTVIIAKETETAEVTQKEEAEEEVLDSITQEAKLLIEDDLTAAINFVKASPSDRSDIEAAYEEKTGRYILTEFQKTMYDNMLEKARDFEYFSYSDQDDEGNAVYNAPIVYATLTKDYPELENYFSIYQATEEDKVISAESVYFMPDDPTLVQASDMAALKHQAKLFDALCSYVVKSIPDEFCDYDRYRCIAAFISMRTENAAGDEWQNHTCYGALIGGQSDNHGYASAFKYLCMKAGLNCSIILGNVSANNYYWNTVKLGDKEYHIALAMADKGSVGDDQWNAYFMADENTIRSDHFIIDSEAWN